MGAQAAAQVIGGGQGEHDLSIVDRQPRRAKCAGIDREIRRARENQGRHAQNALHPGLSARLTVANGARSTGRKRRASSMQIECGYIASPRRAVPDEHPRSQAIQRGTAARSSGAEAFFAACDGNLLLRKTATLLVQILLGGVLALTLAVAASLAFLVFFGVLVP